MSNTNDAVRVSGTPQPAGSVWPRPCPHCGDELEFDLERGLHCDGCDDLTADDEATILADLEAHGPNAKPSGGTSAPANGSEADK